MAEQAAKRKYPDFVPSFSVPIAATIDNSVFLPGRPPDAQAKADRTEMPFLVFKAYGCESQTV